MFYLDYYKTNVNNYNPQRVNLQNMTIKNNAVDSISYSNIPKNDTKQKKSLFGYIAGGIVILAGIIIFAIKAKNGRASSKTGSKTEECLSSLSAKEIPTDELSQLNKKTVGQNAENKNIETKLTEPNNNLGNINTQKIENTSEGKKSHISTSQNNQITPTPVPHTKPQPEVTKPVKIEEQANQAYTQYANKLAKELKLEDKEALIKEALSDLMILKNNDDALKTVLKHINPQNKDFVVKTAVPSILRNAEALDLGKAMETALKSVSPETVDCIDKLAANAKRFKIKSQVDSINLLKSLTKENKKFALEELFPYLAENMDKYKIRQSGIMGKFLDVVTPQNKEFVLNEALPTLLENSKKLNIDITDALKIVKHLNKDNLKNVQSIVDNIESLNLNDADGFLDVDKFVKVLENKQF